MDAIDVTDLVAILCIGHGMYCYERILQISEFNIHRFSVQYKMPKEELYLYGFTVMFAQIIMYVEIGKLFGLGLGIGIAVVIIMLTRKLGVIFESRYPLRIMYRVSQFTVPLGVVLI